MREVQRHNFEFIRTEILNLSIEEFADKIGVSKSSYQRMKSKSYDAEYYFSPIQKACELADISIDMFSTKCLTKELYKKRHKKTQAIVLSKKQLLAFFLFGVVISGGVLLVFFSSNTNQVASANIVPQTQPEVASQNMYEPNDIYFWTDRVGGSYHSNINCPTIKSRNNIESGSLNDASEKKKYDPCDFCVVQ
jgi:transcriptional regulator with XRE-family HTH domain